MSGFEFVSGINQVTPMAMVAKADDAKTTEEHMADYLESMRVLEEEMEPYKDQKRDLKANYVENNWLTKGEISLAVKAYRLAKDDTDMGQLIDMVATLKTKGVGQGTVNNAFLSGIWHIVQVAAFPGTIKVDRRRGNLITDRQY